MGARDPGRRLEDSPLPWAIISSSLQDFSERWRVESEQRICSTPPALRELSDDFKHGIEASADGGARFAEGPIWNVSAERRHRVVAERSGRG